MFFFFLNKKKKMLKRQKSSGTTEGCLYVNIEFQNVKLSFISCG